VPDARLAYARLLAAFHDHPARKLTMVGVTGTEGKTTTASLLQHILSANGLRAGLVSTVQAQIGDARRDTGLHTTTPDAPVVQQLLSEMVEAGLTHCVLEATSHGLAQHRVAACEFDVGVVTNITREHLDFHGSQEEYRQAKARLFRSLAETAPKPSLASPPGRSAVLNVDDPAYTFLASVTRVPQVTYGIVGSADVTADTIEVELPRTRFRLRGPGYEFPIGLPLAGAHNVENALAAFAAAVQALGVPADGAAAALESFRGVPGRMEVIHQGQNFAALVDFAHSPGAVRRSLQAGRRLTRGKLIAVLGAVGLRDPDNRRLMAEAAAELADRMVFTADDPRTESLAGILETMARAAEARGGVEGKTFWRIPHRGRALAFAARLAGEGDLLMALGKGHEQSMALGEEEYPWDDRQALRAALAELLNLPGPPMPFLPE
jgi:UDP-N-acetylmuramoyl-L-alanyl-D-glutamate--2,6-diaminopimelate ligase